MLELVTFTGIDVRTSKDGVLEVARKHRAIEWGILAGSATGKEPRFPPLTTIDAWRAFATDNSLKTALHLCGPLQPGRRGRQGRRAPAAVRWVQPRAGQPAGSRAACAHRRDRRVPGVARRAGDPAARRRLGQRREGARWHRVPVRPFRRARSRARAAVRPLARAARRRTPVRVRRRNPDRERTPGVRVREAARARLPHVARHGDARPLGRLPRPRQGRNHLQTPTATRRLRIRRRPPPIATIRRAGARSPSRDARAGTRLTLINLYAARTTKPSGLRKFEDPIRATQRRDNCPLGDGRGPAHRGMGEPQGEPPRESRREARRRGPRNTARTRRRLPPGSSRKEGHPPHPLYLPGDPDRTRLELHATRLA